jgi:PAS domain S-box-containing protein
MRLWLLEPVDLGHAARIQQAATDAGLTVAWLESIESAPADAALIGVGPSVPDPLRAARQLRLRGSPALLIFFTATLAARDALKAELIRDPFVYPRYEMVDLSTNPHQLAARLAKLATELRRRMHIRRTSRRRRNRTRPASAVIAAPGAAAGPLLAHVLTQTRDAVLSTDAAGRVVTWNEAARRLFGLQVEATSTGEQPELAELIEQVLSSGEPREAQLASARAANVQASAAPIRDAMGKVMGVSVIARDESDYQRIQAALREANRQKNEFLAIMSHELRTPLTSILGYTDMVLRGLSGPLAPLTSKYVGNVRSAGDRLLELVNGLLDFTRLEAGVERLELHRIDLARVVSQVVQVCQSAARGKHIELSLAINGDLDACVEADEERIKHVFRSMLGNALKFTPDGGFVRVRIEPDRELDAAAVRVSISDSGIGMRSDQIGRVWERFYQGDASLTRPYGGMGLGLPIARHLVSLHGGRVGAESSGPGRGSTFWFSIPKRQPTQPRR